jgi:hypothetical protein
MQEINVNQHLSQISTEYSIHESKVDTMVSQADLKVGIISKNK